MRVLIGQNISGAPIQECSARREKSGQEREREGGKQYILEDDVMVHDDTVAHLGGPR